MRHLLPLLFFASLAADLPYRAPNWEPFGELDGRSNSYRRGAGLHLFAPALQDDTSLFFAQGLVGRFYDLWAGSLGVGYRRLMTRNSAWGANTFIDVGRSDRDHIFLQGGLGFEWMTGTTVVRANGYLPFSGRQTVRAGEDCLLSTQGTLLFRNDFDVLLREHPYKGFDVQVGRGWDLFGYRASLWGYAGYFRFTGDGAPVIQGPRLQVEYRHNLPDQLWGAELIGRGTWEYNGVNHNLGYFSLGLRFPLWNRSRSEYLPLSSLYRRMGDRVRRDQGILVRVEEQRVFRSTSPLLSPIGNQRQLWFIEEAGTGPGTQQDPALFSFVEANSNPFDFIVLLNTNGTINMLANDFDLQAGQQLLGFGDNGQLTITADGCRLPLTDNSGRAILTVTGGTTVVTLDDGNRISGFEILDGGDAIAGVGVMETLIENMILRSQADDAITLTGGPSNTTIRNTSILQNADLSILINGGTDTLIDGVTIFDSGDDAISLTGGTNFTLTNSMIADVGAPGLDINNIAGDVILTNNQFGRVNGAALVDADFAGVTTRFVATGNTIVGPVTDDGFNISGNAGSILDIDISDNSFTGLDANGVQVTKVGDGSICLNVERNTFNSFNGAADVILVTAATTATDANICFHINDNTITNTNFRAIRAENLALGASPVVMTGFIDRNRISDTGIADDAITLEGDMSGNAAHEMTVAIRNNTITRVNSEAIFVDADPTLGIMNITIENNRDIGAGLPTPAYNIESDAGFGGTFCLTMSGNSTDRASPGIELDFDGGTVEVTDLPNLSANNNGIGVVNNSGVVITDRATPCPLPPACSCP